MVNRGWPSPLVSTISSASFRRGCGRGAPSQARRRPPANPGPAIERARQRRPRGAAPADERGRSPCPPPPRCRRSSRAGPQPCGPPWAAPTSPCSGHTAARAAGARPQTRLHLQRLPSASAGLEHPIPRVLSCLPAPWTLACTDSRQQTLVKLSVDPASSRRGSLGGLPTPFALQKRAKLLLRPIGAPDATKALPAGRLRANQAR